jgi:hypothetical protein
MTDGQATNNKKGTKSGAVITPTAGKRITTFALRQTIS